MPFQPDTYAFVVPVSFAKRGQGQIVPSLGDKMIQVFWTSEQVPKSLTVRRSEVVARNEGTYTKAWELGQPCLAHDWKARCSRTVTNIYKLELRFAGKRLADPDAGSRVLANNLVHAFLKAEELRLDVETDCGARYPLILKLNYVEAC